MRTYQEVSQSQRMVPFNNLQEIGQQILNTYIHENQISRFIYIYLKKKKQQQKKDHNLPDGW